MNKNRLVREQLDATLRHLGPLHRTSTPRKGWIRAIRDALGMSAKQLGGRLGVAQQAVARIEKDELRGSVTIKTMQRNAECLDCVFVCGFVPRSNLDTTLRTQAKQVAVKRLAQASQTMALEDQALDTRENRKVLSEMVDELVDAPPSDLWDEL
jgi:predicted DNA-binding mobile mystery protein A